MADNKMQQFQWTGINYNGARVNGVVQAINLQDAQTELKRSGIEVISLTPKISLSFAKIQLFSKQKKIKPKDVLQFTRYMATMLAAGLPIIQALDIIAHDQENPAMKALILSIKTNVESGKTLAESFGQYPKQFGELYCSLIKAGEKSGTLDKILHRLEHYLERTESLKRKIKKAMVYPTAILSVALIVSLVLLIFVVPQFQAMFKTFGAQLPAFTVMVVNLSDFVRHYWWLIIVFITVSIIGFKYALNHSPSFHQLIDRWKLKLYIIGPVLRNGIISRYTRTLATTLEAGMPIIDSMRSMAPVMGNSVYSDAILKICDDVTSGNQLSTSMRSTNLFPNMSIQMISVGEVSGTLSNMLNKVADHYEEEVNTTVDNLSSLLEPVIMLVLGVVVGGFVVAMYLPIFKIGSLF